MATIEIWPALRPQLVNNAGEELWRKAFEDLFLCRLESRYFRPIEILKTQDRFVGEGFSIMTLLCSLVEFLESTWQGKNFRYISGKERKKGVRPGKFEYSDSSDIFVTFLCKRAPFCEQFNVTLAREFYRSVRCGLLHEAQTKNGWKIRAKSVDGTLIDVRRRAVFRDDFRKGINAFVREYGKSLVGERDRQAAFVRKFDYLAAEAAK
jgi:hypothetical protein